MPLGAGGKTWRDGQYTGLGVSGAAPLATQHGHRAAPMIRVLLAEDVTVVRQTLISLLSLEPDIEVTAAVAAGDQIIPAVLEHHPDVALLDIGLPGINGLSAAAELAWRVPACRVMMLTGLESPGSLDAALRAGARGFLLKEGPADEIIAAVRAVARGELVIDPRLASPAPDRTDRPQQPL